MKSEQLILPLYYLELVQFQKVDNHHLKKSDGCPYQLRVTIDQGPKFGGKRVTIPLGTRDYNETAKARDLVLKVLVAENFVTKDTKVRMGE